MDPTLQTIWEQLNNLSEGQEELIKDIRVSQDKLVACQELKNDINVVKTNCRPVSKNIKGHKN